MDKVRQKRKITIGIIIAIAAIIAFGLVMRGIERHSEMREEGLGDTGSWEEAEAEEHMLVLGDDLYSYTDDVDTYLIIGTDNGSEAGAKGTGFNGEMADFLTLIVINNTRETYGFIQLDRDTITDVGVPDETGAFNGTASEQLCTAHWYGKDASERNLNTTDTVSRMLGNLPVDGYYTLNMTDIAAVNHAIGGVVVEIPKDMTAVDPEFKEGASVLLDDAQAEKFIRARMSVGESSNAERMSRQRQYMQKVYNLVMSQLRENPDYINELYDQLEGTIDTNMPGGTTSRIANQMRLYESKGILSMRGESKIGKTLDDGLEHSEFYPDQASMTQTIRQLIRLEMIEEATDGEIAVVE